MYVCNSLESDQWHSGQLEIPELAGLKVSQFRQQTFEIRDRKNEFFRFHFQKDQYEKVFRIRKGIHQ